MPIPTSSTFPLACFHTFFLRDEKRCFSTGVSKGSYTLENLSYFFTVVRILRACVGCNLVDKLPGIELLILFLLWWTIYTPIRAKYTAIPLFRSKYLPAFPTFVKNYICICRHGFFFFVNPQFGHVSNEFRNSSLIRITLNRYFYRDE